MEMEKKQIIYRFVMFVCLLLLYDHLVWSKESVKSLKTDSLSRYLFDILIPQSLLLEMQSNSLKFWTTEA